MRLRYAQQFRSSPDTLGQIPITSPTGQPIPLSQLTEITEVQGPTMISSENGLLRGTVLLNVRGRDVGSFADEAEGAIARQVQMPTGYYVEWSGEYENQQRARSRLLLVVPIVLIVIFALLYITYHSALEAAHVPLLDSEHLFDDGAGEELDVGVSDGAVQHDAAGAEVLAAIDDGDLCSEAREEESFFHRRVAAADDGDLLAGGEKAVAGGAGGDAVADQGLFAG